jgi:DnaD/phage-associated family protein
MSGFKGFTDGKLTTVTFPAEFFSEILPAISDVGELKLILCALHQMTTQEGGVSYFFLDDLQGNEDTQKCFPDMAGETSTFNQTLEKTCSDNVFLAGEYEDRKIFFLNTPHSSAALRAMQKGTWSPNEKRSFASNNNANKPNVYSLYEKNIGPLTPILAETLEEAEKEYPAEWLEEAIKIAVKKNVRNWQYIEAILRSWKEKGRGEKDQRNDKKDTRKYIEGDLADYIKH